MLLFRWGEGGEGEVLVGVTNGSKGGRVTILGGKREEGELQPAVTAVREFWEETGKLLSAATRDGLQDQLVNPSTTAITTTTVDVHWLPTGKYALFCLDCTHASSSGGDQSMHREVQGLPEAFASWVRPRKGEEGFDACTDEMREVRWVGVNGLVVRKSTRSSSSSSSSALAVHPVMTMAISSQSVRAWLRDKQMKYTGSGYNRGSREGGGQNCLPPTKETVGRREVADDVRQDHKSAHQIDTLG